MMGVTAPGEFLALLGDGMELAVARTVLLAGGGGAGVILLALESVRMVTMMKAVVAAMTVMVTIE